MSNLRVCQLQVHQNPELMRSTPLQRPYKEPLPDLLCFQRTLTVFRAQPSISLSLFPSQLHQYWPFASSQGQCLPQETASREWQCTFLGPQLLWVLSWLGVWRGSSAWEGWLSNESSGSKKLLPINPSLPVKENIAFRPPFLAPLWL